MHKVILSFLGLVLLTVPALGQNTLQDWNKDFFCDAPVGPTPVGYNLYKSLVSGGPYTKVNSSLIAGLTFNDPTATEGQFFAVSAVNSIGLEGLSDEIVLVDQEKPTNLRFVQVDVSVTITTP